MAFRPILQRRYVPQLALGALTATTFLISQKTLHAEAPHPDHLSRKPIYDPPTTPKPRPTPKQPTLPLDETPHPSPPTPTDRLSSLISRSRRFLHAHTTLAEDRLNALLSSLLHTEQRFTTALASLAPPPSSSERLLPGTIYVLVAAMGGSILTRNRNILLRAATPAAVGLGAAWYVLPITMRNVGELVWEWEERVPVLAENHMRVRGAVEEGGRIGGRWTREVRGWGEGVVKGGREKVEGWVRKER